MYVCVHSIKILCMPDALILSRIQFALNITFHILFPAINIALGWVLLYFKLRHNKSKDLKWQSAYRFWVKIFALSFALGIVTGVTMSFQFGTNWPGYMTTVGNIAGPLLAYETLTAFFLEASFLGIMLFGTKRVSPRVHTFATLMVAIGTSVSMFWILSLNSWMHTPQGFEMRGGKAYVTSWLEVIFNPSFPYRFTHMMIASGLTTGFLLSGVSAYRLLRGDDKPEVMATLKTGIYLAAFLIPIQIFVGDQHGLNTLEYQPAKIAAIEGVWHSEKNVPLQLFALPNAAEQMNRYSLAIPNAGSLLLTHSLSGEVKGLDQFPNHPPVAPIFWAFRIMVGVGLLMLVVSWYTSYQLIRRDSINKLTKRVLFGMAFSGWVAITAGWYTTEIGRQPYLVYGVLKTVDAVTKTPSATVLTSLILYSLLYGALLIAYISVIFYLARNANNPVGKELNEDAFSYNAVKKKVEK